MVDDFQQLLLRLDEIVVLARQKGVTLLGLLVLLDGDQINRPHAVEPILQLGDLLAHPLPVGLPVSSNLHLEAAGVVLGHLEALGLHFLQNNLVLLLNPLAEVLGHHVVLSQFHLKFRAAFLRTAQLLANGAQRLLAFLDFLIRPGFLRKQPGNFAAGLLALAANGRDTLRRVGDVFLGLFFFVPARLDVASALGDELLEFLYANIEWLELPQERRQQLFLRRQPNLGLGQLYVGDVTPSAQPFDNSGHLAQKRVVGHLPFLE